MKLKQLILLLSITIGFSSLSFASRYNLDRAHMSVGFSIKHLVISNVNGRFDNFEGHFNFDPKKGELTGIEAKINLDSINTNETKRDAHLRGPDFFGTRDKKGKLKPKNQYMTFKSTKVVNRGKKPTKVTGMLTLNGKTKPVALDVEYKGAVTDPWGTNKVVFVATGEIKRKDFGLTYNKALETGGLVIGEKVKISIEGEANEQKAKK